MPTSASMPAFPQQQQQQQQPAPSIAHHWFYESSDDKWKPFSMIDSMVIDDAFAINPNHAEPIAVDGGRYDANIAQRTKAPVFWKEERPVAIRRCSWFYRSNADGKWIPYCEEVAQRLENEYLTACHDNRWNRKIQVENGEYIMLHSATVMMHFPDSSLAHSIDDWGQVQPPTQQNPELKPRAVHRGLDGLPDIPDGEPVGEVDHLVFMVHGIGSACDIRFRNIFEVVDGFRNLTADLSQRHFQASHLSNKISRVEFLPVNWHKPLHGHSDQKLDPITLKAIPKLRSFVNDTLLDILFYTSPVYCQRILDTVVGEINRMYTLFMARNERFSGTISLMGHSLGSLIVFDILNHQNDESFEDEASSDHQQEEEIRDLAKLFKRLDIDPEHAERFALDGIDLDALMSCTEEDLKEAELPLGPRKKLLKYISSLKKTTMTLEYSVGPAGTGQPFVKYPKLCFKPSTFYALGSPIGMFLAVRGVENLGKDFKLPNCGRFFNIFHPYDPVAYRLESLVDPDYAQLRPVVVPHHKGRKRMHLELKDTVTRLMTTDFKKRIVDSLSSTLSTMYNIALGNNANNVQQALEDEMNKEADLADEEDERNPKFLESPLNEGRRIDFVLQEAPFESFNEYLFALASHLCYWESEDTCLFILKDIYGQLGILTDEENNFKVEQPQQPPAPTPILAPPPVPIGGQMPTSNPTPILAPPPVPIGGQMPTSNPTPILAPPPVPIGGAKPIPMVEPIAATPSPSAPTLFAADTSGPSPINGPPTLSNPLSAMSPPTAAIMSSSPLPPKVKYPVKGGPQMGMDPTVPVATNKPLGPPPIGGFYSKPN